MKGIVITTDNVVSAEDFTSPLYESVGKVVDGYIEIVSPRGLPSPFCMIVNEEGIIKGLPMNIVGSFLYQTYIHGSPILGNIVIMKYGMTPEGPDIVGLEDEETAVIEKIIRGICPAKGE